MKKTLHIIAIMLLLFGCSSNESKTSNYATDAILKLDTKGHTALIRDIIVTKSGDIISASDDKTIRVWDSATGKEKRKILGQIGAGSEGKIYAMALSPNEEFLAIGGYFKSDDIRIYNYQTGCGNIQHYREEIEVSRKEVSCWGIGGVLLGLATLGILGS
jgi:WD40 repeat protein